MKNVLSKAGALLLATSLLAACAQKQEAPQAGKSGGEQPKNESKNPVNLKFSIWGNDNHKKMYDAMIAKYKTDNPHVTVEIMTIPSAEYQQKLSIMFASKTAPDIIWLAERMIPQFLDAGQLLDLNAVKTDNGYKFADFVPSTLDLFTKEGKLYGIPFSTPPSMMYYNKNLFKAKGLKTPTELHKEGKWTYEEFLKAAKAISEPDKGIYGVNLVRQGWNSWSEAITSLLWSHGADVFSKDGKSFTLKSAEGEKALQIYSDMIFKDRSHPKPGDQTTFESGKLGMQQELLSYMGKAKAIKDFEWDIAPMPKGPAGTGTTLGYAGYTVNKDSASKDEAVKFLKFLSNPENMTISSEFFVPSRKSVLESEDFLKQGPSKDSMKLAVIDPMANAKVRTAHPNWQQIDTKMRSIMDYLYTQSSSVKEVLDRAEKEVAPLLK